MNFPSATCCGAGRHWDALSGNALFDSLTVAENVGYRLSEETDMPLERGATRGWRKCLASSALRDYVDRMPSELSGGERRRSPMRARWRPTELLLFDDPTAGLDPVTATSVDDEIVKLRDLEQVTAIVVTHQIRDAHYIATHDAARTADRSEISPGGRGEVRPRGVHGAARGRIQFEGEPRNCSPRRILTWRASCS